MTTIDVQKPTLLANQKVCGPQYPAFTKLGSVLGKPSGWVSYSTGRNQADGPFACAVIEPGLYGKSFAYRYYMATGADHPNLPFAGGIYIAGSNDPETGWTYINSGNPVIDADDLETDDGQELSSPMGWDYNPYIDKFVLYPHTATYTGPTGEEQVTVRIITADMATFTHEGVEGAASAVVISGMGDHHGYAYPFRVGGNLYLDHRKHGKHGFLEGRSVAVDDAGSRFVNLPEFDRPGSINCSLDDPKDFFIGAHHSFFLGGQCWGVFGVRPSADSAAAQRGEEIYLAPLDNEDRFTITGKPQKIIARGGTGAIDEIACHVPCSLVTDRAVYIYFSAEANTTWAQVIAVAKCAINPDGTYET